MRRQPRDREERDEKIRAAIDDGIIIILLLLTVIGLPIALAFGAGPA